MEVAFHAALTRLGVQTVAGALNIWEDLPPNSPPQTAVSWLGKVVAFVMGQRKQANKMAVSYYRLVRALRTGTTIQDPYLPGKQESVPMETLRHDFQKAIGTAPSKAAEAPIAPSPTSPTPEPSAPLEGDSATPESDELDRILIEELAELDKEIERIERAAQEEARNALATLGAGNQDKRVRDIDSTDAAEVDKARKQAHKDAGNRQAATASRLAMNGARSTIWSASSKDGRAIGYVRLSRTGTPCGWCAMLISRGPVYRSESSASFKGGAASYDDGDKYHDNCNCYAMPIFSREQFDKSDLFALNRQYAEQWPRVTRGLSGKAAVSAWRRFIRTNTPTRAQAA